MRSVSPHLRAACAAIALLLPLAAGCAAEVDSGPVTPIACEDEEVDPTTMCDGATCFEACGVSVRADTPPPAATLLATHHDLARPRVARRITGPMLALVSAGVQVRHGETFDILGSVDLAGRPITVAAAGGQAWVGTAAGALHRIDLADTAAPRVAASWWPSPDVTLVAHTGGHLVLRTPKGVSVLDVSDPDAPSEVACFDPPPGMAAVWHVAANDDLVVAAGGGEQAFAYVYEIERAENAPKTVPIDQETTVALHAGVLLVTHQEQAKLYRAALGQAAQLLASADNAPRWDPAIAGGFVLLGDEALDLDDGLTAWDVVADTGDGCTVALNTKDRSESAVVVPALVPDRRYAADRVPALACDGVSARLHGAQDGAAEPGGPRVAVRMADGAAVYTPATDALVSLGDGAEGALAWVGGHVLTIARRGTDFGIPLTAVVSSFDPDTGDGTGGLALDTALVSWSASPDTLWLLTEGEPRSYGDEAPDAKTHVLSAWRPGDSAPTAMAHGTHPIAIAASADRVVVFNDRREAVIYDASGSAVDTVALPHDVDVYGRIAASALGVFYPTTCGGVGWLGGNGEVRSADPDAGLYAVLAADDTRILASLARRPHPAVAAAPALWVGVPQPTGDTFSLGTGAEAPLPETAERGAIGDGAVMAFRNGFFRFQE